MIISDLKNIQPEISPKERAVAGSLDQPLHSAEHSEKA